MKIVYTRQHLAHDPLYMFEPEEEEIITHHEAPDRVEEIFRALVNSNFADIIAPEEISFDDLTSVHDKDFISYIQRISEHDGLILPNCFATRNFSLHKPKSLSGLQGYYCTDFSTPFRPGTIDGILSSAGTALTGAGLLLHGDSAVFSLTRPPGHHAGRNFYGGFCYVNNAALAAERLSREGKTILLDIDYHHGNGSQDIFYATDAVYYLSIHADPSDEYPYYSGYSDEKGTGKGAGFNTNIPISKESTPAEYKEKLESALHLIDAQKCEYLVVSLGLDPEKDDPLGNFSFESEDFREIGNLISRLKMKTLVVLEGGYNLDTIGECAVDFLTGISE
ncbi:MAG: histone deacetylase family protein [Spirochaetales bacterium]|nr:histone deacetylase family protein [Spirochaetales bacterium]